MSDPLTLEKLLADLRRLKEEIGPPPPEVRVSPFATGLPTGQPRTDDMREMVERLGKRRVPAAYRLSGAALGLSRDVVVIHPDLLPGAPDEH